jgi:hypothetical protein
VCIYIYIYTHPCVCIYIYIYTPHGCVYIYIYTPTPTHYAKQTQTHTYTRILFEASCCSCTPCSHISYAVDCACTLQFNLRLTARLPFRDVHQLSGTRASLFRFHTRVLSNRHRVQSLINMCPSLSFQHGVS